MSCPSAFVLLVFVALPALATDARSRVNYQAS